MQTIAATTTRTGLRFAPNWVPAPTTPGSRSATGRWTRCRWPIHVWHGDWNYTLRPEGYDQAVGVPDPFDRPGPRLAWLVHPALTGLAPRQWDALITTLMTLHDQQRETSLDKRRGHRPRLTASGVGRRPALTLADRHLVTSLHQRLALPQTAIAALFGVRPETVNKCIREIRQLLNQAG